MWDDVGLSGNSVRVFLGVRLSAAENFAKPENVSPMTHQNYNGLPHETQINLNLKASKKWNYKNTIFKNYN